MRGKHLLLVIPIACSLAVLLACGESAHVASAVNTASGGSVAQSTATSTPIADQHFAKGQHVVLDGYTTTINSITTTKGDEFTTPKAGDTFVVVDVTIQNNTGQTQTFSSDLAFTLQDASGQKYDQTVLSGDTSPDGTIPNSGLLRGQVVYEVPTSQKALTFTFQPDITNTDTAIWNLGY